MSDHDDEGLAHDLPLLLGRRRLLGVLGGVGAVATLTACGADEPATPATPTSPTSPTPSSTTTPAAVPTEEIPAETGGPFPGDGSNGPNVLAESGVVREDITRSVGAASGVAPGVPLLMRFRVLQLEDGEATPLPGAALYAWHCDREGRYSMYDDGVEDENFLRGVQVADADGWLQFRTIFPGCYSGRWPHVHFEVYPSVADATSARAKLRTTQLAFPADALEQVYAADGYGDSAGNLEGLTLEGDGVFADGYSLQLARMSGSVSDGYTATLAVPV